MRGGGRWWSIVRHGLRPPPAATPPPRPPLPLPHQPAVVHEGVHRRGFRHPEHGRAEHRVLHLLQVSPVGGPAAGRDERHQALKLLPQLRLASTVRFLARRHLLGRLGQRLQAVLQLLGRRVRRAVAPAGVGVGRPAAAAAAATAAASAGAPPAAGVGGDGPGWQHSWGGQESTAQGGQVSGEGGGGGGCRHRGRQARHGERREKKKTNWQGAVERARRPRLSWAGAPSLFSLARAARP